MDRENEPGAPRPRASSRLAPRRQLAFWGRHKVWAALLLVVLALFGGAAFDLVRIARDLDGGRTAISGLELDNLDDGLVPTIERAAGRLHRADRTADRSPFLSALSVVPGLHDQVQGIRDLTDVGDRLGRTGLTSAVAIDRVLQQAGGDASKRVTLLDTVLQQLDLVEAEIGQVHVGADGRLISPLAHARSKVVHELESAPDRLDEARFYVGGLRRLLAGPSRYLLLGANNAEMRGGAGMPLSGGVVTIRDGDIDFGEFQQLSGMQLGEPDVRFPESWRNTYYRWRFGRSYLETAASPNFAVTGPMYQAMAPNGPFGAVDGVLEVDAVALRSLLSAIGPVQMDGVTYDETNVEQKILSQNYLDFATIGGDRANRVELQSALAKKIFEEFKARDVPIAKLALALRQAAVGRHLIAHSTDPAVQTLWESIGADGSLNPFGLMVTVQNVAANKLDWYIDPKVTLNVLKALDGTWKGRLTVTVANPQVDKSSPQVDGTYDGLTGGTHRTMVAVYLPQGAYDISSPDRDLTEEGPDPPLHMAAARFEIPRGETERVSFEFSLPEEWTGALILPSGRVRPVEYDINGVTVTDAAPTPVFWQDAGDESTPGAPAVAGVLALAGALAALYGVRTRIRVAARRPLRPIPELALRAPSFGLVLYVAAFAVLAVGLIIEASTH